MYPAGDTRIQAYMSVYALAQRVCIWTHTYNACECLCTVCVWMPTWMCNYRSVNIFTPCACQHICGSICQAIGMCLCVCVLVCLSVLCCSLFYVRTPLKIDLGELGSLPRPLLATCTVRHTLMQTHDHTTAGRCWNLLVILTFQMHLSSLL